MMIKFYSLHKLKMCLWLLVGMTTIFLACESDDITDSIANNVEPELAIEVADTVNADAGFIITIAAADVTPGLGALNIDIIDSTNAIVINSSDQLFTTVDTVEFAIDSIAPGNYTLNVSVFDTEGLVTTLSSEFMALSFTTPSNNSEMYVLGSMNGWGGTDLQMELVDAYTWQVSGVNIISSDEFKFANTPDFSGSDWGDTGCDGVADTGDNISCGLADGAYQITFNDQTLEYSLVGLTANNTEMYMPGSMNGWSQANAVMSLVGPNLWQLEDVVFVAGDEFKFANTADWSGDDWSDSDCDGVVEVSSGGGPNTICGFEGTFTVTFNDATLEYTVE
jgi:hypothetical protein